MPRTMPFLLLLCGCVLAPVSRAVQARPNQFLFEAPRTYLFNCFRGARWLEVAHLNSDGRLDLLTDACARLGTDNGFGPRRPKGAVVGTGLVTGDYDADGYLDYLVTNRENVLYYRGDGSARFVRSTLAIVETPTLGLAVSDLDRDGHLDVMVIHEGARPTLDHLAVFYNDRAGGVASMAAFDIDRRAKAVLAADFDEDGHGDVVVLHRDSITILWGAEDRGVFGGPYSIPAGESHLRDLRSGDLDDDGHTDLVVSSRLGEELRILYGTGERTIVAEQAIPLSLPPTALALGHLDSDGHVDLVVGGSNRLAVLLGEGGRSFRQLGPFPTTGGSPDDLEIGDLDRDGLEDVAVLSESRVSIHEGNGAGGLLARKDYPLVDPLGVIAGDFDEDGNLDVVVGHNTGDSVTVLLGDGEGELALGGTLESPLVPLDGPRDHIQFGTLVVRGDFDGDGLSDLAVGNKSSFTISVFLGREGIDFDPPRVFFDLAPIPLRGLAVADLDGDGRDDLLVISRCDTCPGPERGFEQGYLTTYLSNGDATFTRIETRTSDPHSDELPQPGDFDEDEDLDLLHQGRILFGDGTGRLTAGPSLQSGAYTPIVADFDWDGHLDFADVSPVPAARLRIHLGHGDGTFRLSQEIELEPFATVPTVVDLDGDGDLDLISAGAVLRGDGAGSFGFEDFFGFSGHQLAAGDFDGDGMNDVVVANDPRHLSTNPDLDFVALIRNRSLDPITSRHGNVNARSGPVADVLFVNGSTGAPLTRRLFLSGDDPFEIAIEQPPSRSMAPGTRYALYASSEPPGPSTTEDVPSDVGRTCIITPLNGGRPQVTWSTFPRPRLFGPADHPSELAPTTVVYLGQGIGKEISFTIQGFIADPEAPNGVLATTNAVVVESR